MALATSRYDISLNGQGYLLVEESYRERAQQSFVPRFSTGDPSYGDLSFWQFLAQTEYTSSNQDLFVNTGKYKHSSGWDTRNGKAKLARGYETVTKAASWPTAQSSGTSYLFDDFQNEPQSIINWNPQEFLNDGYWKVQFDEGNARMDLSPGQNISEESYVVTSTTCLSNNGAVYQPGAGLLTAYGEWTIVYTAVAYDAAYAPAGSSYGPWVKKTDIQVRFIHDGTDFYALIIDGDNGYLKKNTTTLVSWTRAAADENVTVKITRDSSGNWEVFVNAVSQGTATDNSVTTCTKIQLGLAAAGDITSAVEYIFQQGTLVSISLPTSSSHNMGAPGKCLLYDNILYVCYESTAAAFTFTTIVSANVATNQPAIVHVNARDIAVWSRGGQPTSGKNQFLVAVDGTSVKFYNGQGTVVDTVTTTILGTCIVPIDGTRIAIFGTFSEQDGKPGMARITFGDENWTETVKEINFDGGVEGSIPGSYAFDSNGVLYVVTNNMGANPLSTPSRMMVFNSTDLLATYPRMTSQFILSGFMARGLFALSGSVYLFGAYVEGDKSNAGVMRFPGTQVWRSKKSVTLNTDANKYNHGVPGVWQNANGVIFLGDNEDDLYEPVMELLPNGDIREVAAFYSGKLLTGSPNNISLSEYSGKFYLTSRASDAVYRTKDARGSFPSTKATLNLQLSDMGANTNLISKTLYSVIVELSEALVDNTAAETLTIKVNGTTIGTMTNADGTRKEFVLTSELTAATFKVTLSVPYNCTWQGYIVDGPALKFVPSQFKKKSWAFGVRCTNNLRLADGTREALTASQQFSAIKTAWSSNVPVTLIDIDGTSHTVIVTDYDRRVPLIDRDGGSNIEQLCFVECLEV